MNGRFSNVMDGHPSGSIMKDGEGVDVGKEEVADWYATGWAGVAGTVVVPVWPFGWAEEAGMVPEGVACFCVEKTSCILDNVFGPTMPIVSMLFFS